MNRQILNKLLKAIVGKKIFKFTMIYTTANFLNIGIPFLMLPILTRYLSTYDYGLVATFQALRAASLIMVKMGAGDAVARAYYDRDKEGFQFRKYLFNAIVVISGMFIFLCIILLLTSSFASRTFSIPALWLLIIPIVALTNAITSILLKLWVFQGKPVSYSVFQIGNSIIDMSLSLFFIIVIGMEWKGRILGIGIAEIFAVTVSLFLLIYGKYLVYSVDFSYLKEILKYGVPVFIHSICFWVIGSVDRLFLNSMVGVSTTGIYSVGYSIAGIIGLAAGSFSMAWTPIFYEKLGSSNIHEKNKIVKLTYLYFICILLFASFLIIISPYILKIMVGRDYYGAERYIAWIAFANAFYAMYTMVCGYIFYSKKTNLIAKITFISAVLNLILTYILIKKNGAIGAAQATFCSYLFSFIATWYWGNKVYSMRWFSFYKPVVKAY